MNDSVIVPTGKSVTLGGGEYIVKPVRFPRVYKFKRLLFEIIKQLDKIDIGILLRAVVNTDADADTTPEAQAKRDARAEKALTALDKLLDVLLTNVGQLFAIAIPKLDPRIFDENADDETAPDVLEMWDAFNIILEVNHLHFIKNRLAALTVGTREPQTTETPMTTLSQQLATSISSALNESAVSPSPN